MNKALGFFSVTNKLQELRDEIYTHIFRVPLFALEYFQYRTQSESFNNN